MPWDAVMGKFKTGSLRSGNKQSGPPVHNPDQAIAIMLSEKRKAEQGDKEYQPMKTKTVNLGSKGSFKQILGRP